jgi:hypothetical protein
VSTYTRPGTWMSSCAEIDTGGTTDTFWWVLQDPNHNVVALVSDGSTGASTARGEVARQYSWSPYGELLRADIYDTGAPMSRLGHQGLFHDRLDANILSEPMVAFARQSVRTAIGRFCHGSAVSHSLIPTEAAHRSSPISHN